MKINPVDFTYGIRKIMNSPVVNKNFYIEYLQNVDYSKKTSKIKESEKISPKPSDVEEKVKKGQWPQGWYGSFPTELFVVNMPSIEYLEILEMVQKIKPVYGARVDYGATILKPTTEDLTKIYKYAFKKSKIDLVSSTTENKGKIEDKEKTIDIII